MHVYTYPQSPTSITLITLPFELVNFPKAVFESSSTNSK